MSTKKNRALTFVDPKTIKLPKSATAMVEAGRDAEAHAIAVHLMRYVDRIKSDIQDAQMRPVTARNNRTLEHLGVVQSAYLEIIESILKQRHRRE